MVALAPGIVLAGFINWDMWAVALLALGMYFFSRNKLLLAGLFIGLGTATKLYPAADPRRRPAPGAPHRQNPRFPGHRRRRGRGLAGREHSRSRRGPGRLEVLLSVHRVPAGGVQLAVVRLQPRGRTPGLEAAGGGGHQRLGPEPVPAGLCADRGAGSCGPAAAAAGPAGVPDRGRLHPHQQGVLATVRDLADPAAGTGPAAGGGTS